MSTTQNVNLPVLPDWVQQHLRTLYGAQTDADFDTAFDAFVAPHARITLNGRTVSRAEYKKTIRGETQGEASATVTFNGVVSVLGEKQNKDGAETGAVGVFFTAELFHRFIVFGARQANTVHSSLNVEVVEEPSATPGIGDHRRVSVLSEVLTDTPNKIVPPTAGKA